MRDDSQGHLLWAFWRKLTTLYWHCTVYHKHTKSSLIPTELSEDAPSQWDTLHCNVFSRWLGAYTKSSLILTHTNGLLRKLKVVAIIEVVAFRVISHNSPGFWIRLHGARWRWWGWFGWCRRGGGIWKQSAQTERSTGILNPWVTGFF